MRINRVMSATAVVLVATASMALANGPKIYPHHSQHNFCPAGLQPVTISGVICCGTPNQSMSYQQALSHPVKKKVRKVHYVRRATQSCPVGTKGCS